MDDQQNSKVQVEVGRMSLATLAGGAAVEKFDAELERVLQNISDINTTGGDRSITLAVKIKPDKERSFCRISVHVSSRLQPEEPFGTQMFLGREGGRTVAFEHNPEQLKLGYQPHEVSRQPQRIGGK